MLFVTLVVLVVAACGCTTLPPDGSREWVVTVTNDSAAPATLFVAEDLATMGPSVGTAVPSSVPAGVTQVVVFTVPAGAGWAIFVNPGPDVGPLILAGDVPPGRSGVLPIRIRVERDRSSNVAAPGDPGWFGN